MQRSGENLADRLPTRSEHPRITAVSSLQFFWCQNLSHALLEFLIIEDGVHDLGNGHCLGRFALGFDSCGNQLVDGFHFFSRQGTEVDIHAHENHGNDGCR